MARNGHHGRAERRPLSGVGRTSIERCKMSGDDPKQTFRIFVTHLSSRIISHSVRVGSCTTGLVEPVCLNPHR